MRVAGDEESVGLGLASSGATLAEADRHEAASWLLEEVKDTDADL